MDIALARTFLMVAETGSFIDAARKMNITQSTVSARIRALEELSGVRFRGAQGGRSRVPASSSSTRWRWCAWCITPS